MASAATVDVSAVINNSPIGRFQYLIFFISMLIMMCDGFDTQAVAYVAPSLAAEWKLAPGSFGPVFAAVLLGAMIGAFLFGYLADRIGRSRTLALCPPLFGVPTIASAPATPIQPSPLTPCLWGIAS